MGLLDLFLPSRCAACGREGPVLCARCTAALSVLRPPLCDRCGAATAWPVARCGECAGRRLAFVRARAAVAYEGPALPFVRIWKEGGRRGAARVAAALVAAALERPEADAIAFVPAVRDRELWRGHNPARELARELGRLWRLPLVAPLARSGGARRQRGLGARDRRRNVAGAFAVAGTAAGRLVLVDDVYTSGSTVAAAASALRAAGAAAVDVVTFARAVRDPSSRVGQHSPSARLHLI